MKSKKIIVTILMLSLIMTACTSKIYKTGVDYNDYPDRDLPVYDDAIVYEYEVDNEEVEIVFGSEDDMDDVIDFYKDFFDYEGIYLTREDDDRDGYYSKGRIEDFLFKIEIEEPKKDLDKYYESITTINIEYKEEEIITDKEEEIVVNTSIPEDTLINEMDIPEATIGVTATQIMDKMTLLVNNYDEFSHMNRIFLTPEKDITGYGSIVYKYFLIDKDAVADGNLMLVFIEAEGSEYLSNASVSYIFQGKVPDVKDTTADYSKLLATAYIMAIQNMDNYSTETVNMVDKLNSSQKYENENIVLTIPSIDSIGAYTIKFQPVLK